MERELVCCKKRQKKVLYLHLPKTATDSLFDFKKVSVLSPGLLRSYHQLGYALLASSKCLSSQNFTLLPEGLLRLLKISLRTCYCYLR